MVPLLRKLVNIDGLNWVRLLYVYPENISEEFLELFATEEKIVKYLDIPVQHGSNSVLKRMNRDVSVEHIKDTIKKLRHRIPDVSIRTSVMVGFRVKPNQNFSN